MSNEIGAVLRNAQISAQKCRLVADLIRKKPVNQALQILKFTPKKAAVMMDKLLTSAIHNAENNAGWDIDDLQVSTIFVDEGASFKRMSARAKGRGDRILRRTAHITIKVALMNEGKE